MPVLVEALDIHEITASLLINRGLNTPEEANNFLHPKLSNLPDPFSLPNIKEGVQRIVKAMSGQEKIMIFGDYDADGITSTALLTLFFRQYGIDVEYYIPNRISEGYGLNIEGINYAKAKKVALIITVDNGSSALREIDLASSFGIDVVITDHHEIPASRPKALALINPKDLKDNNLSNLSGVGVVFFLAAAIKQTLISDELFLDIKPDMREFLELVTIGTVADIVPLTGVNRTLVKYGLERFQHTKSPGIEALLKVSSTDPTELNAFHIGFRLGPRINAAGRLGKQNLAFELLTTKSKEKAIEIAHLLNSMNSERQSVEKKIFDEIDSNLQKKEDDIFSIVEWSENWHAGVIGIVASKLANKYFKPCALISFDGMKGRGSVRSIHKFNIMETLKHCSDCLENFGGHMAAAGFDIKIQDIDKFRDAFESHIKGKLSQDERIPRITIDSEITLSKITDQLVCELGLLEPFGEGNPRPVFSTHPCDTANLKIVGNNHLKLEIKDNERKIPAIGFNFGDYEFNKSKKYCFAGLPQTNTWNNRTTIQFKIEDIKEA